MYYVSATGYCGTGNGKFSMPPMLNSSGLVKMVAPVAGVPRVRVEHLQRLPVDMD
jgi:hypothetical protein